MSIKRYIDIHTHCHKSAKEDTLSILNLNAPDYICCCGLNLQSHYSLGIHPWKINKDQLPKNLHFIEKNAIFESTKAIGECGLDKLCDTPWELQMQAFFAQIQISKKLGKPLIIHCVKAFDELIALKKEHHTSNDPAWIIHGFRGKPQQMEQLIQHDFYLSFGIHFNEETVRQIPRNKFFLETDDTQISIQEVYEKVKPFVSDIDLEKQIQSNFLSLK